MLRALAALLLIAGLAHAEEVETTEPLALDVFTLGNGLRVAVTEDIGAASVVVQLRYEAGATDERADEAGYTKLLGSLLGAGSVHVTDFEARIDAVGGWTTTSVTSEYLAVTDQVRHDALELVLWLEAERMAGVADAITDAAVMRARDALASEYRAAYVDAPYATAERELERALWTDALAPYGRPVLGDGSAVKTADAARMRDFARERIVPNRALLVITGDIDVGTAHRLAEHYFGWIPGRRVPPRAKPPVVAPLAHGVELAVTDPVPKVIVAFRAPPFSAALDVAAQLLAGGRTARLSRRLVDGGLASEVHVELVRQHAGELRIYATPAEGVDGNKVAAAIREEIRALRTGVSAGDVARAAALAETDYLVTIENPAVRADRYAAWLDHDGADWPVTEWTSRLRHVDAAALQREVTRWLADSAAVTVVGAPEAR